MQSKLAKLTFVAPLVVFLVGAVIQQVRYPDSSAWIVALLAAGYLLLIYVVARLADAAYAKKE